MISRDEARRRGLKRYFTGEPCKNGHVTERLVSGGKCVACDLAKKEKKRRARGVRPSTQSRGVRAAAKATGSTRYFTGVACPKGHLADRLVSSGHCVECHNLQIAQRNRRKEDAAIAAKTLTGILGVPHEIVGEVVDAKGTKTWQPAPVGR